MLLKTDSYPFWRFSETQFRLADYTVTWQSMDARAERPDDAMSQYEERLTVLRTRIFGTFALLVSPTVVAPSTQAGSISLA